jgi:hypothetical protein
MEIKDLNLPEKYRFCKKMGYDIAKEISTEISRFQQYPPKGNIYEAIKSL